MSSTDAPAPFPVQIDADRLATLTLEPNQGPMVILDHALIRRLSVTLDSLRAQAPAGLVLASGSSRVFVAGADLKSIDAMTHTELEHYLHYGQVVFAKLCSMPCPTAAAINGAALGGGLELAMHCDALIGAPAQPGKDGTVKPFPIGLPEAGLAICPGWGGTNLLPARMNPAEAIARTCEGKPLTSDEARAAGLFDAFAPTPGDLLATAKAWLKAHPATPGQRRDGRPLRWLGRDGARNSAQAAFTQLSATHMAKDPARACMLAVRAGLEHGWEAALVVERTELNRLRSEPAGKAAICAFLNKAKA
jgi:3-hydroxyacyl-CoA dehydrogenase/enoyl-CoA hydratase/3-hydroxybutyryl-CoA epimerase